MVYLTLEQILQIHCRIMEEYGEGEQAGVMFKDKLLSAVLRPQAKYFGEELFPTIWDKTGALTQSLAQQHPFHNGNKRTAFVVLQVFLRVNGYSFQMPPQDAIEMMVDFVTKEQFKGEDGAKEIGKVIEKIVKSSF